MNTISVAGFGLAQVALALFATLSAFLSGLSRGGFAGSIGLFAVPILTLAMPASDAAAALLLPLFTLDCIVLVHYFGHWDSSVLRRILPASAIGLGLGWWLVDSVSDSATVVVMGSTIMIASMIRLLKSNEADTLPSASRTMAIKGYLWGTLSGFSSFISHTGGGPLMVYVLGVIRSRKVLIATIGIIFAVNDFVKLFAYGFLGRFNSSVLLTGVLLTPIAIAGYTVGKRHIMKISERGFQSLSNFLLLLAAVWMIGSGASNLMG